MGVRYTVLETAKTFFPFGRFERKIDSGLFLSPPSLPHLFTSRAMNHVCGGGGEPAFGKICATRFASGVGERWRLGGMRNWGRRTGSGWELGSVQFLRWIHS